MSLETAVPPQAVPAQAGLGTRTLDTIDQYLIAGKESDASDIHLGVASQPIWRRFGRFEPIWLQAPVLTAADTERLARSFLTEPHWKQLMERGRRGFRLRE